MPESVFKCKGCGNPLLVSNAVNGVVQCEYCHLFSPVPKKETSPAALSFLRQGEHDLDTGKFGDAYTAYLKALEYDKTEPEAYWGMALAEFKVRYIRDEVNNRLQPICYEFTDKAFTSNANFREALRYATDRQRENYRKLAEEIDYIREQFLKLKQSGVDYDCFICVKVSKLDGEQGDPNKKNWTDDAYNADGIYDLLKRNGYTPFYSEREIHGRTGADYEAMILYALYTSETMLVVCSDERCLKTRWVQNEYTRFLKLVNDEEKESDSITIVYSGAPIERLEGKRGKIQGIDYSRREADLQIVKFVDGHTPIAKARREQEKRQREEEEHQRQVESEQIKKKVEEQERAQREFREQQERAQREFFEKQQRELAELRRSQSSGSQAGGKTVNSLLTRAYQELEVNSFDTAKSYFKEVIDSDPFNAEGWWGQFLVEFRVTDESQLYDKLDNTLFEKMYNSRNFKSAVNYAANETKERIDKFKSCVQDSEKWWRLFLKEFGVTDEKEIYGELSDDLVNMIHESCNYKNAVKYASGATAKRIEEFNNRLKDSEIWWNLFLTEFGVTDEKQLYDNISNKFVEKLHNSRNYKNAVKFISDKTKNRIDNFERCLKDPQIWWKRFLSDYNVPNPDLIAETLTREIETSIFENENYLNAEKYADDKFKQVIEQFKMTLNSPDARWRIFLQDFSVNDESGLLEKMKCDLLSEIERNKEYHFVTKSIAESENDLALTGENARVLKPSDSLKVRVNKFCKEIYSGEFWWDKFLKNFHEDDENKILDKIVYQSINFIENNENYLNSIKYASEKFLKHIDDFKSKLYSAEFWWKKFLTKWSVENEQQLLDNFVYDDYQTIKDELNFIQSQKFSEEDFKQRISAFVFQLDAQARAYKCAQASWDSLLKKCHCSSNLELSKVNHYIANDANYKDAVASAEQSKDKELLNKYKSAEQANRLAYDKRKANKRAEVTRQILLFSMFCIPSFLAIIIIPSVCWNILPTAMKISLFVTAGMGIVYQGACRLLDEELEGKQPVNAMIIQVLSTALYVGAILIIRFDYNPTDFMIWSIALSIPVGLLIAYAVQIWAICNEDNYLDNDNFLARYMPIFTATIIHMISTVVVISVNDSNPNPLWHIIVQLVLTSIYFIAIAISDISTESYGISWIIFGIFAGISIFIVIVWLFWIIVVILVGLAVVIGIIVAIVKKVRG